MKQITSINEIRQVLNGYQKSGLTVGLVPTMGFLHEGHLSLIETAKSLCDRVVVSIFVNPMQFGANEDLASYPRDLQRDLALCENAGASIVFCPEPGEVYHSGFSSFVQVDGLTAGLCGKSRPAHFRGVTTVVAKLFNIVKPQKAFFGQKDAQQLAVIKKMVYDLDFDIEIIGCPIVREADGLAKSSRNSYLNAPERTAALVLSRALHSAKQLLTGGETNTGKILEHMRDIINAEPLAKIDYAEAVDALTLEPVLTAEKSTLFAVAVYIGKTRLIDNFTA